eukprot:scaffold258687_cov17-Tisochrysis_lutea.AAC.1
MREERVCSGTRAGVRTSETDLIDALGFILVWIGPRSPGIEGGISEFGGFSSSVIVPMVIRMQESDN